ncbi:MAG TPA: FecR family protein, partial [Polyangiaceae bacterium]|nr:FecR family protein [Polyangiaceae bacterium]
MTDFHTRVAESREHVQPRWTCEREREIHFRVLRAAERRKPRFVRRAALLCMALVACAVLWQGSRFGSTASARLERLRPMNAPLLVLADGSAVRVKQPETRLSNLRVVPDSVSLELVTGAARFEIAPNPRRHFQVRAGTATVTVLGTVFEVALRGDELQVTVERGRVRVEHGAREHVLDAGEQLTWSVRAVPSKPPPAPALPESPAQDARRASAKPAVKTARETPAADARKSDWRELAVRKQYDAAYELLSASGFAAVGNDAGDLLLAADVARLSGHPADAVAPLQRATQLGRDARAGLAAFTLGRVLLEDLGQPARAAGAFRKAFALAPRGPL